MITTESKEKKVNLGYNTKRIREIIGMKQDVLANILGVSQPYVSALEQSENIPEETLEKIAKSMGVTPEFIKNFNEDKAIYNIQSNFTVQEYGAATFSGTINLNNPVDKITELFEKLLHSEREKMELLMQTNKAIMELNEQLKRK